MLPPSDYVTRGKVLYCNGFGVQYAGNGTEDTCVIAHLSDKNDTIFHNKLEQIQNISKCLSVQSKDWIGYNFIAVHWTDTSKIDDVLDAVCQCNITFQYFCKLKPIIIPDSSPWSRLKLEKSIINYISAIDDKIQGCIDSSSFKIWNWETLEGKNFCQKLRMKYGKSPSNESSKNNYWNWPLFKNYDRKTLLKVEEECLVYMETKPMVFEEECLVCMDAKPDTMVFPCRHCVVCQSCSIKLQNTNDATLCMKCRCPIISISNI